MNKNRLFLKIIILFIITGIGFVSCKTTEENSFEKEMEILNDYLKTNNITVAPTASGLYYIELREGTGEKANAGDTVTVKYIGKLLNGTVFDSGTFTFILGKGTVIKGWDEGIAMMRKGGVAQLIIPSNLAYGANGAGTIQPYTTLLFSVELLDIK
jgi:FKBP-type peptidyl-prolyl cis-trans isomerase